MIFPLILAHGTLGNWDEMIFIGVAVVFLVLMGISWMQSRNAEPEFDDDIQPDAIRPDQPTKPDHISLE